MEFKDRIKMLREQKGINLTQLAVAFDLKEAGVRSWENGRTKPGADTLIKLAKYFECSTDYLLGLSDSKTYKQQGEINSLLKTAVSASETLPAIGETTILEAAARLIISTARLYQFEKKAPVKYLIKWLALVGNSTNALAYSNAHPDSLEALKVANKYMNCFQFDMYDINREITEMFIALYVKRYDELKGDPSFDKFAYDNNLFSASFRIDNELVAITDEDIVDYEGLATIWDEEASIDTDNPAEE
jgi:Predicted transcription factor, homolog of eukaryotic MBF1